MGWLRGDIPLSPPGTGDQWLIGGADDDVEWDSLGSVLAPEADSPTANGDGAATMLGNAGQLWR